MQPHRRRRPGPGQGPVPGGPQGAPPPHGGAQVVPQADDPWEASAYGGVMGKTILTILGVLLAVWLVVTVIGAIFSMLKFFFFIGLVAVVVVLAVTAVSKMSKSR
ncbi:hypothetical protein GCM10010177_28300 [Actinomadura citrea]|nr:hypothetical protein GCM10010177_28300 [Actinomadura citrea]